MNHHFQIKTTGDQSKTVFIPGMNEHYHSTHGVVNEAQHVFIEAGMNAVKAGPLSVLEIGFGTGLNAFMTFLEAERQQRKIRYTALEAHPLWWGLLKSLDYPSILKAVEYAPVFRGMHAAPWQTPIAFGEYFVLDKLFDSVHHVKLTDKYNVIYFDAFGPDKQPDMWTDSVFEKMFKALLPGGILVTYSAKGEVKRTMKRAGFEVEALPGPPGKREMTRGRLV